MTKKIILTILCLFILFSCGKKADPKYNVKINNFFIKKI